MWIEIHISWREAMRTIQMTIDEGLLDRLDQATQELGTTRSAFIRDALRLALHRLQVKRLEHQHRDGYARQPVAPGEFDGWESEQAWGDDA
jgi:Arc/MetJ-type ribon-helix-helix transcriptional regulator